MNPSSVPPAPIDHTYRNWQNTIGGWITTLFMSVLTFAWDPFAVYSTWEDGLQGFDTENILLTAFFFTFAAVAFILFAVPKVHKSGTNITVVNPLYTHIFQSSSIISVTEGFTHTKIVTHWGTVRAWGLELTNYELIEHDAVGPARRAASALRDLSSPTQFADEHRRLVRAPRRPSWSEVVILAGWVTYVAIGLTLQ